MRHFLLILSRTSPLHQTLSISTAKEVGMVRAGASCLLCVQQVHGRSKWHLSKQTYSTVNEAKHRRTPQSRLLSWDLPRLPLKNSVSELFGYAACSWTFHNCPVMGSTRKTCSFCVLPWVGWRFFTTSLVSVHLMAREHILCLLRPCVLVVKDFSLLLQYSSCNLLLTISPLIYTAIKSCPFWFLPSAQLLSVHLFSCCHSFCICTLCPSLFVPTGQRRRLSSEA